MDRRFLEIDEIYFDIPILQIQRKNPVMNNKELFQWKGDTAWTINDFLNKKRDITISKRYQNLIDRFDESFQIVQRSERVNIVYRGINENNSILNMDHFLDRIGEKVIIWSYLSTSYNAQIAKDFACDGSQDKKIILQIYLPPDYPFIAIDEGVANVMRAKPKSEYIFDEEDEILLPRGRNFFVKGIKNMDNYNLIKLIAL